MFGMIFRLLGRGLRDMRLHPLAQGFTFAVVSMVCLLGGLFLLLLHNVNQELLRTRGEVQFQVFWSNRLDLDTVKKQWTDIRTYPGLKELQTFTPDMALVDLSGALGDTSEFTWLKGQNPLPPTAMVTFATPPSGSTSPSWAQEMLSRLKGLPGVERVHFNPMQMDLAKGWLTMTQTLIWPVIGFLGLVVALVVGNTMKLSLLTRRDEIEILYLVGAREWFIRLPLLTAGAVQGLLGSLTALGLLKIVQLLLKDVLNVAPIFFEITFLPLGQAAMLSGVVFLVCIVSSWAAVRQ